MPISKNDLNKFNNKYRFNMVNINNEKFNKLGLEPLYLTSYPNYINLSGNIFYSGPTHYECNLINDVTLILKIMNSNKYDRFKHVHLNNNYSIYFSTYNNQIFFNDIMSLNVYKNNSNIRNEINKAFNLKNSFYEPTRDEIYLDYGYNYFLMNKEKFGNHIEYHSLNLTPEEYFELMISSKKKKLSPFIDANELNGFDIRNWLNCNANVFMNFKCPWETTGIYNEETMKYINILKETKLNIYNFFYDFSKQSKNWQMAIKELLTLFGVYSEFVAKEMEDNTNPFDNVCEEELYWDNMFIEASFDILIQFIGFDKIETQLSKTITTSKPNIYEEFFNLLIMGYNVIQLPKLIFEESKQQFKWIYPKEFINSGINRECENEIKLIKKYIPFNERYKYLR